jgi:hypothetical protein
VASSRYQVKPRKTRIPLAKPLTKGNSFSSLKKFATIFALVAALLITDLHWCVLQSVTWANMISESQAATFSEKVADVLSGQNPCDHCIAIESERSSEGEKNLDLSTKSILLSPIASTRITSCRRESLLFSLSAETFGKAQLFDSGIDHPPRV